MATKSVTQQTRTTTAPAATTTAVKRVHNRKPPLQLLAAKLDEAITNLAQIVSSTAAWSHSAQPPHKENLVQISSNCGKLHAAATATMQSFIRLVDGKYVPPENAVVSKAAYAVGDRVRVLPNSLKMYERFYTAAQLATLEVTLIAGTEGLAKTTDGREVLIHSWRHVERIS